MHPPNPCSGVPSKNVKLCLEIKRLGKTKQNPQLWKWLGFPPADGKEIRSYISFSSF